MPAPPAEAEGAEGSNAAPAPSKPAPPKEAPPAWAGMLQQRIAALTEDAAAALDEASSARGSGSRPGTAGRRRPGIHPFLIHASWPRPAVYERLQTVHAVEQL